MRLIGVGIGEVGGSMVVVGWLVYLGRVGGGGGDGLG